MILDRKLRVSLYAPSRLSSTGSGSTILFGMRRLRLCSGGRSCLNEILQLLLSGPIGFLSHQLTPAEFNYTIYDKELFQFSTRSIIGDVCLLGPLCPLPCTQTTKICRISKPGDWLTADRPAGVKCSVTTISFCPLVRVRSKLCQMPCPEPRGSLVSRATLN